jgi:hypothetical protein
MPQDWPERKCAYSGCGTVFKPKRKWGAYCTRECQQLSYIDRTRSKPIAKVLDLERRVLLLENWRDSLPPMEILK